MVPISKKSGQRFKSWSRGLSKSPFNTSKASGASRVRASSDIGLNEYFFFRRSFFWCQTRRGGPLNGGAVGGLSQKGPTLFWALEPFASLGQANSIQRSCVTFKGLSFETNLDLVSHRVQKLETGLEVTSGRLRPWPRVTSEVNNNRNHFFCVSYELLTRLWET